MRRNTLLLFLMFFFTGLISLFFTPYNLIRLGWRAHGLSWYDLSFLHLNWIFHPKLPYWNAHMQNLAGLLGVVIVLISSLVGMLSLLRHRLSDSQSRHVQKA